MSANLENNALMIPRKASTIDVSVDVDLLWPTMLYVGTGGDVEVIAYSSELSVVLKNVPDGTFLPMLVKKVIAGGTTASDILALG